MSQFGKMWVQPISRKMLSSKEVNEWKSVAKGKCLEWHEVSDNNRTSSRYSQTLRHGLQGLSYCIYWGEIAAAIVSPENAICKDYYFCHHPLCNLALFLDNISCLSLINNVNQDFNFIHIGTNRVKLVRNSSHKCYLIPPNIIF